MRASIRAIVAGGWALTTAAAITIAATVILRPPTAYAVQYVKVCALFPQAFFYLPGTDTCVNLAISGAQQQTAGGPWQWRWPNNPHKWLANPKSACPGGRLVKFGDITGSNLTQNSYSRYETTTQYPLNLKQGQYIASVLYKGALAVIPPNQLVSDLSATCTEPEDNFVTDATDTNCTAGETPVGGGDTACEVKCVSGAWQLFGPHNLPGLGDFCMFYYYNDPTTGDVYTPLGCANRTSHDGPPATLAFTPDTPIPPATENQVYVLGASGNNRSPGAFGPPWDTRGMLSVWLCLQTAPVTTP